MMRGEERAGAEHAGLDFVQDEEGSILRAEGLGFLQVVLWRDDDAGFGLHGLDEERRVVFGLQFLLQRRDVAEGDGRGVGEHGSELAAPERFVHQRERAAGKAVKSAVAVEESFASGGGAGKFDSRFHTFTAGASEKGLFKLASGEEAKALGEISGEIGHVALQHRGSAAIEFGMKRFDHGGMVMADVVDAVARQEIEQHVAFRGVEFRAGAERCIRSASGAD